MNEDTNNAVQCVIRLTRELETVRQETLDLFVAELEKELIEMNPDRSDGSDKYMYARWDIIKHTADRLRGK